MNHTSDNSQILDQVRLLAAEVRDLGEQLVELRSQHAQEHRDLMDATTRNSRASNTGIKRHVTATSRETLRQTEALAQLLAKAPTLRAPLPPSGGFPMDAGSLLHLAFVLEELRPSRILELGGGTSTIWMAYLTEHYGSEIISFDHLEEYRLSTNDHIQRHRFSERVDCRLARLEQVTMRGESFDWYSPKAFENIRDIDLLVVDGPPQSTGIRARFPALPMLHTQLTENAVIVLDDCHREEEQSVLGDWSRIGQGYQISDKDVSRLGVLKPVM